MGGAGWPRPYCRQSIHTHMTQALKKQIDPAVLEQFATDESGLFQGEAIEAVCYPDSEADLAQLLAQATAEGTLVTVSGAGTGITGGRVATHGGVVVTTESLTAPWPRDLPATTADVFGTSYTIYVDEDRGRAVVPAGLSIEHLGNMLPAGLLYPPDPTEKTALLGGTVATNASGARTFHHGPTRDWILGLRVVLPSGDVLNLGREEVGADGGMTFTSDSGCQYSFPLPTYAMPALKNAAGLYARPGMDLVDLFIGSEGILGVVSEATVKLTQRPTNVVGEIAFFNRESDALNYVEDLRKAVAGGEMTVLSLEYFDRHSLEFIEHEAVTGKPYQAGVYAEAVGLMEDLDPLLEALEANSYADDWFAEESREATEQKDFRHALPEGVNSYLRRQGSQKLGTDFVVPPERFPDLLGLYREAGEAFRSKFPRAGKHCLVFGHIGDYHLHFNFLTHNQEESAFARELYVQMARQVVGWGGTISGEHGVGKKTVTMAGQTVPYLQVMYGREGLREIARVKRALDPSLVLNVGNMVSREYLEEM